MMNPRRNKPNIALGLHMRRRRWYWRVRVPKPIQHLYGRKTYLVGSCHTSDKTEATHYAMKAVAEARSEFNRQMVAIAKPKELLGRSQLIDGLLEQVNELRQLNQVGGIENGELELTLSMLEDQAMMLAEKLKDPEAQQSLSRAFHAVHKPELTGIDSVVHEYLQATASHVTKQTLRSKRVRLEGLVEFVGKDTPIAHVDRRVAGAYAGHLQSQDRGVRTSRDILSAISTFFNWATTRGYTETNPFSGQARTLRESTRATGTKSRRNWKLEELKVLLRGTIEAINTSTSTRQRIQYTALHALTCIGLYSGMRLNEICSLRVEDVKDGVFRVTEGKTKAARRTIPIHPAIQGLVDTLSVHSSDGYLIPGLQEAGPDAKRSWNISKVFGRWRKKLGLPTEVVFHELRGNFITALEDAGVPLSTIETLVGHERKALAYSTYSSGPSLKVLREAVQLVDHGASVRSLCDPQT